MAYPFYGFWPLLECDDPKDTPFCSLSPIHNFRLYLRDQEAKADLGQEIGEFLIEIADTWSKRQSRQKPYNEVLSSVPFPAAHDRETDIDVQPAGDDEKLELPGDNARLGQPGRPSNEDDDWAYEQIEKGRDKKEVYAEWLDRIPEMRRNLLVDPRDSFNQAMRYRRKREKQRKIE